MFDIVKLAFILNIGRHKGKIEIKKALEMIENDVINKLDMAKNTPAFMREITEMYDMEKLRELKVIIDKEISNRNIKAINNEL